MEWLVKIAILYYCGGGGIILSLGFICFGGTVEDTFLASYRVKYLSLMNKVNLWHFPDTHSL